jgi:hypothetical protein
MNQLCDGETLKQNGMAAALQSADKTIPRWTDHALVLLNEYARGKKQITSDGFRAECKGLLPDPPSLNSFGALFSRAAKAGIIEQVGFVKSRRPSAHSRVLGLWQAVL